MSLHILDTDTLTLYQTGHAQVVRRVLEHPLAELAVTVVSVEEQLGGWYTRYVGRRRRMNWLGSINT